MICPYLNETMTQTSASSKNEESGVFIEILQQTYAPPQCAKENCAAWDDDKCNYNKTR